MTAKVWLIVGALAVIVIAGILAYSNRSNKNQTRTSSVMPKVSNIPTSSASTSPSASPSPTPTPTTPTVNINITVPTTSPTPTPTPSPSPSPK